MKKDTEGIKESRNHVLKRRKRVGFDWEEIGQ